MADQPTSAKVVLVTGAGSGIGRAIALQFADSGHHVGVLDRDAESAHAVSALIDARSDVSAALALAADVSDAEAMQRSVACLDHDFCRLDVVVANAGGNGYLGRLEDFEPEQWDEVVAQNLRGLFLTARSTLPLLKRRQGTELSSLLVIASIHGSRVFHFAGATPFTCCKAAQLAFVKALATHCQQRHRRLHMIHNVEEMAPLRRTVTQDEVGGTAVFLASPLATGITGQGQVIYGDAGM